MPTKSWTLEKAKNSFSAVVAAAERGEPQLVTKRGKPVAYVVRASDYEAVKEESSGLPKKNFIEHLLSAPKAPPGVDVDELFGRANWTLRDVDLEE